MITREERALLLQEHVADAHGLCLVCGEDTPCPVVRALRQLGQYADALGPFAMLSYAAREGWEMHVALLPVPDPMGFFAKALATMGDAETARYSHWYATTEGGRRQRPKSR